MSDSEFYSEPEWLSENELGDQDDEFIGEPIKSYTIEDLWIIQQDIAGQIAEALALDTDICFFYLNQYKWQKQELVNAYLHGADKTLRLKFAPSKLQKVTATHCPLCADSTTSGIQLGCGHAVCCDCFDQYINYKIADGQVYTAICPGDDHCKRIIGPSIASHYPNYRETSAQAFLRYQSSIVGCPTPDCKFFHQLNGSDIPCECGATLCGECGYFAHAPVPCEIVEKWLELLEDDKDLLLRVTSNTKTCPKCKVIIEKQIGCSHMTCACGYEFCWQCLGTWVNYGHQCARYEEPAKKKNEIKRFAHYAPRYTSNFAASQYHSSAQTTSDRLNAAHQTLRDSRQLIAWTFVMLFYLSYSNQRILLEDNLVNLEQSSERLGEYLRQGKSIEDIIRLTGFVTERRKTLLDYTTSTKWKYM